MKKTNKQQELDKEMIALWKINSIPIGLIPKKAFDWLKTFAKTLPLDVFNGNAWEEAEPGIPFYNDGLSVYRINMERVGDPVSPKYYEAKVVINHDTNLYEYVAPNGDDTLLAVAPATPGFAGIKSVFDDGEESSWLPYISLRLHSGEFAKPIKVRFEIL